ncbi:hypothetical protein B5J94_13225, partial [Moraxella lacunata]
MGWFLFAKNLLSWGLVLIDVGIFWCDMQGKLQHAPCISKTRYNKPTRLSVFRFTPRDDIR